MTNKEAIKILEEECRHTENHLKEPNKAPEYYEELGNYVKALDRAIEALHGIASRVMDPIRELPLSPLMLEKIDDAVSKALTEEPDIIYKAMIPLNPKCKKNNQRIAYNTRTHRPIILQSDVYKQYEFDCGFFLKMPRQPIDFKVNIQCVFYRDSARRVDLTNLLEAIDDILVKYKIIKDDNFNIIGGHDGSRVYVDKLNPRTEIIITKM